MQQWKLYLVFIPCLFLLLLTIVAACSQPPAAVVSTTAPKPAEFEVGPITFEPPVVMVGDSVAIEATVNNTGNLAGTYTAILLVDGQETGRKDITVDPGSSQKVSFQLSQSTAGSHQVAIGSSSTVLTIPDWSPYTLRYEESDGAMTGIYVSGDNGHIVRFTPLNKAFKIQKIWIAATVRMLNTSYLDKNYFTLRIWDKDRNNQLWSQDFPWRLFMGPPTWREIKVPDVRVNDDFNVELVTHSNPAGYRGDGSVAHGGDPIDFIDLLGAVIGESTGGVLNVVVVAFDYPQSYIKSPSPANRPETRSGYSYMGKLIDPGQGRFKGINWLIRVEGEGAAGN